MSSPPTLDEQNALLKGILADDWHYVTKNLTTEQRTAFADAVDDESEEGPVADRWWDRA